MKSNRICILGLGYVGLTLSLVLAEKKFKVFGYDSNKKLINDLSNFKTHIYEKNIKFLLKKNILNKNLILTDNIPENIDTFIITVGTPVVYDDNKKQFVSNLNSIKEITNKIALKIKKKTNIIFRSTIPIGTCNKVITPILNQKNLKIDRDYYLSFAPERTIEGNAIYELKNLPQIVAGGSKLSLKKCKSFFNLFCKEIVEVDNLVAGELIKLINNSFRDLSFAFSNQVAMICNKYNLDTNKIILSANKNYPRNQIAKPSPGVGGPCLTKDPYILEESILKKNNNKSIFSISRDTNNQIINELVNDIIKKLKGIKNKNILICGLAFKGYPLTKDYRGSVSLIFFEKLNKIKNFNIKIHDPLFTKNDIKKLLNIDSEDFKKTSNYYDCVVILNNNKFYKKLDFRKYAMIIKNNGLIYDYWSLISQSKIKKIKKIKANLKYKGL
jgi:UDP-N-acetyl-D-mannosaminuronic acid dehydrogenase